MKYCEECGAKLEDDAIFCEECGAKQSSVVSSEPNQDISPKPSDISASAGSTPIQNQNKNQNPVFETPAAPAKKASSDSFAIPPFNVGKMETYSSFLSFDLHNATIFKYS